VANDGQDDSNVATVTITVNSIEDGPPTAEAGGPYTVAAEGTVVLDASGTVDPDLPYESLTYDWDFDGDGEFDDATGESPTFVAAGLSAGDDVTVTLLVTDSALTTSTDTAVITVQEASTEHIYTSTDGPIQIGDLKTVTSTVLATSTDPIDALNVRIDLQHNDAANLQVRLLDPNGAALSLASTLDSGDLYYGVMTEGTTLQHSGTWTLEITDGAKDKVRGTLYSWSLIVNPVEPLFTAGAMAALAGFESTALAEPTAAADSPADTSSTQTQLDPEVADALLVESAPDPFASDDLATDQEEMDEAAFDAAMGEFDSDPLDGTLDAALA
jgi:subtilisin-like proprotein convertase family protein